MLNDVELTNVYGGKSASYTGLLIVGGIITFIIGVIDGYLRPLKCN